MDFLTQNHLLMCCFCASNNGMVMSVQEARMSKKQLDDFLAAIQQVRALAGTPEQARQLLEEEGVHTPSGELTEAYR